MPNQNGWVQEQAEGGGQLVLHCGARTATREDVAAAVVPAETVTYKPLAHMEFINSMQAELQRRQVEVVKEYFALQSNGQRLFGMFDISTVSPSGDFRAVMGFRNSYDMSYSAGIVSGTRVFVCDNLAFSGEFMCLRRRHTHTFVLEREIGPAIDRFENHFGLLCGLTEHLKGCRLSDRDAKALIHDTFIQSENLPIRLYQRVDSLYFRPAYEEFEPRSAWSLYNAFTSAAKEMRSVTRHQEAMSQVTGAFRKVTGYRTAADGRAIIPMREAAYPLSPGTAAARAENDAIRERMALEVSNDVRNIFMRPIESAPGTPNARNDANFIFAARGMPVIEPDEFVEFDPNDPGF